MRGIYCQSTLFMITLQISNKKNSQFWIFFWRDTLFLASLFGSTFEEGQIEKTKGGRHMLLARGKRSQAARSEVRRLGPARPVWGSWALLGWCSFLSFNLPWLFDLVLLLCSAVLVCGWRGCVACDIRVYANWGSRGSRTPKNSTPEPQGSYYQVIEVIGALETCTWNERKKRKNGKSMALQFGNAPLDDVLAAVKMQLHATKLQWSIQMIGPIKKMHQNFTQFRNFCDEMTIFYWGKRHERKLVSPAVDSSSNFCDSQKTVRNNSERITKLQSNSKSIFAKKIEKKNVFDLVSRASLKCFLAFWSALRELESFRGGGKNWKGGER